MDDLNILLKFINTNNTFSDFDLIQNYVNSLNFNKLRGGSINTIINENYENKNENENEISENINDNKYIINEGTILFHASKNKSINTNKIKVGDVNLYAYFTNNLNTATNTIKLFNLNEKYIHVFKTKKNINNLVFDMSNYNENKSISKIQYGGICFKYPYENRIQRVKNNLMINNKLFPSEANNNENNNQNIEIALFDIKENLEYLYTLNCHNIN
jgi:hypothetical protein